MSYRLYIGARGGGKSFARILYICQHVGEDMPLPAIKHWSECMHVVKLRAPNPEAQKLGEASINVKTLIGQREVAGKLLTMIEGQWESPFGRDVQKYLRGVVAKG